MATEDDKPRVRGRGFGGLIRSVLFEDGEADSAADSMADGGVLGVEELSGEHMSLEAAPGSPASASNGARPVGSIADADFPTLYGRAIPDGDPHADSVLTMFESIAGMPEDTRRTALGAMLKGLGANPATIAATLGKRLQVLQAAARQVKETEEGAQAERTSALTALEGETREQVAALKAQIAALEARLDTEVRGVQSAQAESQGKLAAYDARVRAEQLRLGQLAEFLRSLTAAAKTK